MSAKKKKANSFHVTEQANMTMLGLTFTESGQNYNLTGGTARDGPYTTNVRISCINLSNRKLFEPIDSFKPTLHEMPLVLTVLASVLIITIYAFSLHYWSSL